VVNYRKQREMKIELVEYTHSCEDGCCYVEGYDVLIDDVFIGATEDRNAEEVVELLNKYLSEKSQATPLPNDQ
jgi:hypothetical protein